MDCASCACWYKNGQLKRKLELTQSDLEIYKAALEIAVKNKSKREYLLHDAIEKCIKEGRI